ncbi:MAG TPA: hypothetical protein VMU84_11190, partial [Thermoanaerobaculia bacterium]|nr:hypothetical protein [Thermoanaerobaculia bacterium]
EVRAKVTFLKIRVKIKGFIGWEVQIKRNGDQQAIELVMTEYREEKSSSMEWWKWLLSALGGITAVIAAAVVNLAVRLKIPGLPKNVFEMPMEAVAWPYYEQLRLDSVALPSPVVIAGTPKLLEA